jgi:hypothetical protein
MWGRKFLTLGISIFIAPLAQQSRHFLKIWPLVFSLSIMGGYVEMAVAQARSTEEMIKLTKQWMEKEYPLPEVGKWKALYTPAFAEKYNLPSENISESLPQGIDYMEMDVQYFNGKNKACMVNLLAQHPNDFGAFNNGTDDFSWADEFNKSRKLTHFVTHKTKLKQIDSLEIGSTTFDNKSRGFRMSTSGFFAQNYLPGYDYFSLNSNCLRQAMDLKEGRLTENEFAILVSKASVWGKYQNSLNDHPPQGQDFLNAFYVVPIPGELVHYIHNEK